MAGCANSCRKLQMAAEWIGNGSSLPLYNFNYGKRKSGCSGCLAYWERLPPSCTSTETSQVTTITYANITDSSSCTAHHSLRVNVNHLPLISAFSLTTRLYVRYHHGSINHYLAKLHKLFSSAFLTRWAFQQPSNWAALKILSSMLRKWSI